MVPPSHAVCSPGSTIMHLSSVFSSCPLPTSSLFVTRPQGVPLSQVFSQMWLFSPAPYCRRTAALTCSAPLWEGLIEQWLNASCTQECLLDPAVASTPRLRPGASPPQKKFARQCSSSISGIMENHNTHLASGCTLNNLVPAPANVAAFRGLLGPGGFNSLYQMSFQQWNCFSPCGLRTSWTPLFSWGFALPTTAPPGIELWSCSLCAPLVDSLDGI